MEPVDEAELARIKALPWISRLDAGDVAQFVAEYEAALRDVYRSGQRMGADRVIEVWRLRALDALAVQ